MYRKKTGFSVIELMLVLFISGLLILCIAPAVNKEKKVAAITDKIYCIPGGRIVVANMNADVVYNHLENKTGEIELPPGIKEFYITMSAGGAGGNAFNVYDESNDNAYKAGGGGGGAGFVYKYPVSVPNVPSNRHLNIKYSLGGGGIGGCSKSYYDSSTDLADQYAIPSSDNKNKEFWKMKGYVGNDGQSSTIWVYQKDNDSTGGTTLVKTISMTGGYHGNLSDSRSYRENVDTGVFIHKLPNLPNGDVNQGGRGGGSSCSDPRYCFSGHVGEHAFFAVSGQGGASVMGVGSFGAGGAGGMDAMPRKINLRRGKTGFRRCGEDGGSGIMIIEYESVCKTLKG